ncbi:sensor histidine kinase [Sphingomonas quercus]|uniref:histidine kinase n=1 Tax=Sphingomonas quercus TaxID=2842451 RepID=A0ABS6BK42_9SPHN|nr:HAMP domain-containing sensor histidine kinase [Sphingomonas quercus]MBU3077590.1 HAMP domain-containing histidine kinase [Sphingomonas quercus]
MPSEPLRLRDIRHTSTFRLASLLGLVFALGIVILLAVIYTMTVSELTARSDLILREVGARLVSAPAARLPERVRAEIASNVQGLDFIALIGPDGQRLTGNIRVPARVRLDKPVDLPARPGVRGPIRLLALRAAGGHIILIGRDISQIAYLRSRFLQIFLWSGLAAAIGGLLAGVALSLRPLRRVRDLQQVSRAIAAGALDARMPIAGRGDELDQFAGTVNVMVEEVGRVIAQVKGVTDAIAHDLRTPLAHVRTSLLRTRGRPDTPPAFAALAAEAVDDLDAVLDRFAALLRISELEASARRSGFRPTDLARLAERAAELYEPLAEERGQTIIVQAQTAATIEADEPLLFEALSNVLDNAIKFSGVGDRIDVIVGERDGDPGIEVRDHGPGIAAEERDAVLRRFHRGANAGATPGSGLGLSVVAAIAHLHRFGLELENAGPGLRVRIRCPR